MKNVLKLMYMFFMHPALFWKYSVRKKSKYFLLNGRKQNVKTRGLVVGKNVRLGDSTRINFYDEGKLRIGDGCYIGQNNTFLVGADITIGKGTLMASYICIASENHGNDPTSEIGYGGQTLVCAPVNIGKECWIGEKVVVLPGVSIGDKAIIGAASVVTRDVPACCIAAGNPARIIKQYDFDKKTWIKIQTNTYNGD